MKCRLLIVFGIAAAVLIAASHAVQNAIVGAFVLLLIGITSPGFQ